MILRIEDLLTWEIIVMLNHGEGKYSKINIRLNQFLKLLILNHDLHKCLYSLILITCLCICVSVCFCMSKCAPGLEERDLPEAGVVWVLGPEFRSSARAVCSLNVSASPPAPRIQASQIEFVKLGQKWYYCVGYANKHEVRNLSMKKIACITNLKIGSF